MKLFNYSLILVVCLAFAGLAGGKQPHMEKSSDENPSAMVTEDSAVDAHIKLLHITANVDGSGRIIFTGRAARYENKNWSAPTDVTVNGKAWENLDQTPAGWKRFSKGLDLSRAWIVERAGRDVIALEQTAKGFDLYLCDSPNGAADYSVTIAIPEKD
jgi:hypothetical protein